MACNDTVTTAARPLLMLRRLCQCRSCKACYLAALTAHALRACSCRFAFCCRSSTDLLCVLSSHWLRIEVVGSQNAWLHQHRAKPDPHDHGLAADCTACAETELHML